MQQCQIGNNKYVSTKGPYKIHLDVIDQHYQKINQQIDEAEEFDFNYMILIKIYNVQMMVLILVIFINMI